MIDVLLDRIYFVTEVNAMIFNDVSDSHGLSAIAKVHLSSSIKCTVENDN